MKTSIIKITTAGGFVLAAFGIILAIGAVSCKTAALPPQPGVSPGANRPARVSYYTCGMHPEIHSQDPDGKCPICQMPLIPVEDAGIKQAQ